MEQRRLRSHSCLDRSFSQLGLDPVETTVPESETVPANPIVVPFLNWRPVVGPSLKAQPEARIIGRSQLGSDCFLDTCATIRGDGEHICIGDDCWFGEHATVHIVHEQLPARIGTGVTVGPWAVVHAAEIGDDAVIGGGAVVMDRAIVGRGTVLTRDAFVPPGKVLEGGLLYAGVPALPVRTLYPGELAKHRQRERWLDLDRKKHQGEKGRKPAAMTLPQDGPILLCDTVRIEGNIRLDAGVSLWFGTRIFNPRGRIEIGERTNIQDNTVVLIDGESTLAIGRGVTVGHNATLEVSRIMDGALIGMGAHVTHGTVIEEHACLAAGAVTSPNTVISRGMLWAGRPARPVRMLTKDERSLFSRNADIYCNEYLGAYARTIAGRSESFSEWRMQWATDQV